MQICVVSTFLSISVSSVLEIEFWRPFVFQNLQAQQKPQTLRIHLQWFDVKSKHQVSNLIIDCFSLYYYDEETWMWTLLSKIQTNALYCINTLRIDRIEHLERKWHSNNTHTRRPIKTQRVFDLTPKFLRNNNKQKLK